MAQFSKNLISLLLVLLVGGIGGMLADRMVLPYLAQTVYFGKISWIKQSENQKTVINKTERITITEDVAIEESVARIKASVVGVLTKRIIGKIEQVLTEGTGFILTADGLIVTSNNLLPVLKSPEQVKYYIVIDQRLIAAQLLKKDTVNNLAILKIQESNLSVVYLADADQVRLGQRVILIGAEDYNGLLSSVVNISIIRSILNGDFILNLKNESGFLSGGPLINVRGEVIGLSLVDAQGNLKVISVDKIKDLLK